MYEDYIGTNVFYILQWIGKRVCYKLFTPYQQGTDRNASGTVSKKVIIVIIHSGFLFLQISVALFDKLHTTCGSYALYCDVHLYLKKNTLRPDTYSLSTV